MGGGGSQTIEQTFNLSAVNKSIFNQMTKNTNTLATSLNNIQQAEINIGVMKSGCTAKLGQTINASSTSVGQLDATMIAETKERVQGTMQAAANASLEKATEAGSFQFGDKQNVKTEVNMAIENVVKKTFSTENLNEVYAEVVNLQEGKLNVGVCDGDLVFDQNIVAQLSAEAVTKSLASAISDNSILSDFQAKVESSAKSENKGIADIVGTLFEGLTGPMKYGIIASVVCCFLLVLVMIVIGLSPAGQSATANLGKAGANRLGRRF